jgi:hypothetical protein
LYAIDPPSYRYKSSYYTTTLSLVNTSDVDHFDDKLFDIYANQIWNSGGKQFLSQKTPTCILLNKDKEFESFGFDAENQYADMKNFFYVRTRLFAG